MVEIKKEWVCNKCKAIVPREKRKEHLLKAHSVVEFYDYVEVVTDTWEK